MATKVKGRLVSSPIKDFSGFKITAIFVQKIDFGDETSDFITNRVISPASAKGNFEFEIPDAASRRGPIHIVASSADGLPAGSVEVPEEGPFKNIRINVKVAEPTEVTPNEDLTLGERIRYTARAIDPTGRSQPANLLVVLWARRSDQESEFPISVARTAEAGYFSGDWPADSYEHAFAVIAGGRPVPILLENGFLPRRFIIVAPPVPAIAEGDEACECEERSPRAPEQIDLGTNPESFADDARRCVDFTAPNRTVEEVAYQAVVRTTQPELKGTTPRKPPTIPPRFIDRLVELAKLRPKELVFSSGISSTAQLADSGGALAALPARPTPSASTPGIDAIALGNSGALRAAFESARVFAPGIDLEELWTSSTVRPKVVAERILAARAENNAPLRLESSVLAELARDPDELTPEKLLEAEQTSVVRNFRINVDLLDGGNTGRFQLNDRRQIDWEQPPYAYQATTIAHGHLLTIKQVWRADGYSMGDLLYSLPLAPGQQKLISILDWNREEVSRRRAQREETEDLAADLSHDRDVSDIIRSTLSESMRARSSANTRAVGGAIGGFIGALVFGGGGGVASASSTASQTSARSVTGLALNRVRDRTLQAASAVRTQRSSVVQTARQGESVRAQTEVVANYNHCHAVTVEYFEVLRHFQITQELAQVQECLFIPFAISTFSSRKALRWRSPLRRLLRQPRHGPAFEALERMQSNWEDADFPVGRYADEPLVYLDGDFKIRMRLPRPKDDDNDDFVTANWQPYRDWLWDGSRDIWERYLGVALPEDRDQIWDSRIAPGIAQRILEQMRVHLLNDALVPASVSVDVTLVSRFFQNRSLRVSLRANVPLPNRTRAQIQRVRLTLDLTTDSPLPDDADILIESGSMRYRSEHFTYSLFRNRRVVNDFTFTDPVEIATPLSVPEKRNPRQRDVKMANRLLDHLNEHIEYYHRVIWMDMDPNRRYMLLDGFIAPDADGRSVASVVENKVIGIVGNCLVMPVAPGQQLDSTYEFADTAAEDLRNLYAADPAPPMRISVPTSGVFAEAVPGQCNSCEVIDDTRFWRWEEAPIPDRPTLIAPLSTASLRRTPPPLTPDAFPEALVRLQDVPTAPDPTGLAAAVKALGVGNVFKDLTGLALNQENAANALKSSIKAGQGFATQAAALAQQRFLNRELDRGLDRIKTARDQKLINDDDAKSLTESLLRGAIGEKRPDKPSAIKKSEVQRAIERVSKAKRGSLRITRSEGSLEIRTGDEAGKRALDVAIDPDLIPIKQPSNFTCWAAGGAMMESWRTQTSMTIETVLDGLGGEWRGKFDRNEGLTTSESRAFFAALNLVEEGAQSYTPEGLARLLADVGPLVEIGDDSIENNLLVHLRIITAVKGDGSPAGTTVTLADSATGTIKSESFTQFARRHEASDAVKFGVGLFHF